MRKTVFIYAILDSSYIQTLSLNGETLRFNVDKSKFIFKTYKEEPKLVNVPFYPKKYIKDLMLTKEWRTNLNIN